MEKMIFRRPLALLAVSCAGLLGTARDGRAEDCPSPPPPRLEVSVTQDPAQQDRTLGIRDLQRLSREGGNVSGLRDGKHIPLGLTATDARYGYTMEARVAPLKDGTFCASLSALSLSFQFSNVAIHIARELPAGSCIEREVTAHENRHVAVDAALVQKWRTPLAETVDRTVRALGTVRLQSAHTAGDVLGSRLKPTLDQAMTQLLAERNRLQAEVDTDAEYARIGRSCNGEGQQILRTFLGTN